MRTKQGSGWANRTRCKKKKNKETPEDQRRYIYGKYIQIPITIIKKPVEYIKQINRKEK